MGKFNRGLNSISRVYRRHGILLVLLAALLLEGNSLFQYFMARKALRDQAEKRAETELAMTGLRLDNITTSVEVATKNMAWVLAEHLSDPDSFYGYFHQIMDTNLDIIDVELGFTPYYYPEKGYWYEPLTARRDGGVLEDLQIGSESHDYFNLPWFKNIFESGIGGWSEPYFDESGGREMVVTYAEPVFDQNGKIVAVLGSDLSLKWLSSIIENIRLYPNSFSTMTSREGQIIASPAETLTVGKTVRYETAMPDTGWKMSIVIPEDEIFRNINKMTNLVSLLQLLGLLFLLFIVHRSTKEQMKLREVEEKKDRIESELKIANGIQMSMIPKIFPPFPERQDLDLAAEMYPAKDVGGDLYDFYIREEKLYFCIGDVSGKGVPASLVMAVTRSLFRTVSAHETSPQRILTTMNESMAEMNENSMFVTFFCGVLDLASGHLRYCNAGHNAPMLLSDEIKELPVVPNLPLGVLKNMNFQEQEIDLSYDDALFLYTDGLTEAENAHHQLFGMQRVMKALHGRRSASQHLSDMNSAVMKFVAGAPQSDDLTMLFILYMNKANPEESERHLILHNDIQQIPQLAEFVETIADAMNLEQSLAMGINLALEEAVTNVIMYAYPKGSDGLVDIEAILRKNSLDFIITDSGVPFDPTSAAPQVDTTLGVTDRPIGGLGIFLVRNIMDTVSYERIDGKNVLSMSKKINSSK